MLARRIGLLLVLVAAMSPLAGAVPQADEAKTFDGKVVPLADLVEKTGSRLDADAAPHWLALVTTDGQVFPLVKDGGARMFFKDPALLNRPMRITGKFLPGSHVLRVTIVRSLKKGEPCDVYYWCDICAIKRSEKNICECCGGPMKLVEEPLKK
jgi:hypothetical protein